MFTTAAVVSTIGIAKWLKWRTGEIRAAKLVAFLFLAAILPASQAIEWEYLALAATDTRHATRAEPSPPVPMQRKPPPTMRRKATKHLQRRATCVM